MKKVVSLLAVLFLFAGLSFASTIDPEHPALRLTGVANFSGKGSTSLTFELKPIKSGAATDKLTWTDSSAFVTSKNIKDIKWVKADQYAEIKTNITDSTYKVYMYQTNTYEKSIYKATKPRSNGKTDTGEDMAVYNGLVSTTTNTGSNGYIPVAYSMVGKTSDTINFNHYTGEKESLITNSKRSDRFFVDAADYNASKEFPNGIGEYTMIGAHVGPVFACGPYEDGSRGPWTGDEVVDNTAYMYFFGGFYNIEGREGEVFGTDQLHIQGVVE